MVNNIKLIILFGSRAMRKAGESSDIDIAVLADHPLALKEKMEIAVEMAKRFHVSENMIDIVERGKNTSDSYRQSFSELAKEGVIKNPLAEKLATSAQFRNILVYEYDFEEDYRKFYDAASEFLPTYREYIEIVYKFVAEQYKS